MKTVQRYRKELLENPQATLEHKNSGETTNKTENWFYFDGNGRAVTGKQKLVRDGAEKTYYFYNGKDGLYGALKED